MALIFYTGESERRVSDRIKILNETTGLYENFRIPDTAAVALQGKTPDGRATIGGPAVVETSQDDPNVTGSVHYDLTSIDIDVPGWYDTGWYIHLGSGEVIRVPIKDGITVLRS